MKKNSWDEALNHISEKFISEAAETHAKNAEKQHSDEKIDQELSSPVEIKPQAMAKKSRKGTIIGVSAAAAAVAACAIGSGVLLGGNPLMPNDTSAVTDPVDGAITFSMSYEEGQIIYGDPNPTSYLNNAAIFSPITAMSDEQRNEYILNSFDINMQYAEQLLGGLGYELNEGERSHWNGMENDVMGEHIGAQITLQYDNGDNMFLINFGEDESNYSVMRLPDDSVLMPDNADSGLIRYDGSIQMFDIGGYVYEGTAYYAASFTDGGCAVYAKGCTTEEFNNLMCSLICGKTQLTPTTLKAFDSARYQTYMFKGDGENVERTLDHYYTQQFISLMEGVSTEPLYNVEGLEDYYGTLRLYPTNNTYGQYDYITLHETSEGVAKYYYRLANTNSTVYFELTEEQYNELWGFFTMNMPTVMQGTIIESLDMGDGLENRTDPEKGSYLIQGDSSSQIYMIHYDEMFEIGNTVNICYYGGVMTTYPLQLNVLWVKSTYGINTDDTPVVAENAFPEAMDLDVYYERFCGVWESGNKDASVTFDYTSGDMTYMNCIEQDNGYLLVVMYGDEDRYAYFIPKNDTEVVYEYPSYEVNSTLRSDYERQYVWSGSVVRKLTGRLNYAGSERLVREFYCDDGSFSQVFAELNSGFTDANGVEWNADPSSSCMHVKDYRFGTIQYYAELYMQYVKADDPDTRKWFSHMIKRVDTDTQYKRVATLPCNDIGEIDPDCADKHIERVGLSSYNYYANISYTCYELENGTEISYPVVYITDAENDDIICTDVLRNAAIWSTGGVIPKNSIISMCEIKSKVKNNGMFFAVFVPVQDIGYMPSIYYFDGTSLNVLSSMDIVDRPAVWESGDLESFMMLIDGGARHFIPDVRNMKLVEIEADIQSGNITPDFGMGSVDHSGFGTYVSYFGGTWASGDRILDLNMGNIDTFSCAEPCLGWYSDDTGSYMLGEDRIWFIPVYDSSIMYYFDNVESGKRLLLSECTEVYDRITAFSGFGSDGEKGYIGLLELCHSIDEEVSFDISDFFDIEITDEKGTRWVRTADKNVDWGGVYEININGKKAHCFKMQNANDPTEMRYFSFFFSVSDGTPSWNEEQGAFRTDSEKAVLTWTDEHYCFDMTVCSSFDLPTEYAALCRKESDNRGHGTFSVSTDFYPLSDGSYYAQRRMGNSQAQWISDSELFYNDGSAYQPISDELGYTHMNTIGDRLFVVHNSEKGLDLSVFSGAKLVDRLEIADDGQITQMSTWASVHGNHLVIEYYDSTKMRDVYAVVNGISATLSVEYYNSLRFNDDGTVDFPEG